MLASSLLLATHRCRHLSKQRTMLASIAAPCPAAYLHPKGEAAAEPDVFNETRREEKRCGSNPLLAGEALLLTAGTMG